MTLYLGDVQSVTLTSNGSIFDGPSRVKGIHYVAPSHDGLIELKNGGASGSVLITIATPASGYETFNLPGDGVVFSSNVYANLTNITSLTVFYA